MAGRRHVGRRLLPAALLALAFICLAAGMSFPAFTNAALYTWPLVGIAAGVLALDRRSNLLLSLAALLLCMFIAEAGAALYELSPVGHIHEAEYVRSGKIRNSDPLLRSRLIPSSSATETKIFDQTDVAYKDVAYSIDEKSRRVTVGVADTADQHALFLGCSFTFGTGVQQEETLPSRFQGIVGDRFKVYNYGEGGYGPSQTLLLLQRDELFSDVYPKNGIAIYSFIEDHLNRCTPHSLGKFVGSFINSPLYRLDTQGALIGPYKFDEDERLARYVRLYKVARRSSPLFRVLDRLWEFTYTSTSDSYDIAAGILVAASQEYKKQFDGEFYVLIWPRVTVSNEHLEQFVDTLIKNGIRCIRVPELPDKADARIHHLDHHPSAAEYAWVARHVADVLPGEK